MWRTCARYSARLAERQLARAAVQQPYAQMRLQPVDVLPDCGGTDARMRAAAAMLPVSAVRVKLRISCNRFMTNQLATMEAKYRLGLNPSVRLHRRSSRRWAGCCPTLWRCAPIPSSPCPAPTVPASSIACPACCSTTAATSSTPSSSATRKAAASSCACISIAMPACRWRPCTPRWPRSPRTSAWTGSCTMAAAARLLVLVSKQGHCLNDLLFRAHSGQLKVDIAAVASNHADFAPLAPPTRCRSTTCR